MPRVRALPSPARRLAVVAALAALAGLALPARAGAAAPRPALVACAPGYPGTTEEAAPAMDALAAALSKGAALGDGGLAATYLPGEADGVARLGQPDAAVALVPIPFFLKHGAALGLTPRLAVETQGGGLAERWSLVAKAGRVKRPEDLAAFTVLSLAGYAPDFVRAAPGPIGHLPASAKVAQTSQVLSALRKALSGDVAVLLDGAQAAALPTLPFAADLEVVARSVPLPTALVCTVGERLPKARWAALEKALLGLDRDPAGAAALAGLRMVRFAPLDPAALAAARALVPAGGK